MSQCKYSIILPYAPRLAQFSNTLGSWQHWYSDRDDWEVVVVFDNKVEEAHRVAVHAMVCTKYPLLPVQLVGAYSANARGCTTGCEQPSGEHYNQAARLARGKFLMLTCPEAFHEVNILAGMDKHFATDASRYVVCACAAAEQPPVMREVPFELFHYDFFRWYQHSVYRPSRYHFCSVIARDTYMALGGFWSEYAPGVGYDDNDWRDSVVAAGYPVIQDDTLLTVHQWHDRSSGKTRKLLVERNRMIYLRRCAERGLPVLEN